jgi:NADPH-dependent 2,4-dienoyl-CoA reductase/sulfur reductase-like enzyme/rhodanese-related sulfurtransferase
MSNKYVIIGGVAGGATAAGKIRREDEQAEIVMFERGPYVSFANCGLPYYIGGDIKNRDELLLMTPDSFWEKYRVQVHAQHEITEISPKNKKIKVKDPDGKEFAEDYDKLILSPGAEPIYPPLPGIASEHVFKLRTVPDMDRITDYIEQKKPQTAVVIGGGFIGLEMAEAFHQKEIQVTVVEMMPHILPPLDQDTAMLFTDMITRDGFDIIAGNAVQEIKDKSVVLNDGKEVAADVVLVSAGVKPEIALAQKAGLTIGEFGGIVVNDYMQTSDESIYAVGDAIEIKHCVSGKVCRIPLAGPANRQGRIAAINVCGGKVKYKGALGTSIVKVFEYAAAMTGLSERLAESLGFDVMTSMTLSDNHSSYYPGASSIWVKLIYEAGTGKLLGAQTLGEEGTDKRLDVLATAIHAGMTVENLEDLDLSYAPPFGSANDPVNVAGFVATHILKGDYKDVQKPSELLEGTQLIDVRNPDEIEKDGQLENAINIPLPIFRDNVNKIDKTKPVVLYCVRGYRSYLALRILAGNGFKDLAMISGGYPRAKANGWL